MEIIGKDYMKNKLLPDPNVVFPVSNTKTVTYIKPTIKNKNIIVGDFTYFSDVDFENHVTHFYDFYNDKLIIGKFCQIASGVEFIMNGANHQMNCVSTFPFYIFEKWDENTPSLNNMPIKGNNYTPTRYDAFTTVKDHNLHYRHSKFYAYVICYTGSTLYIIE
jgi:virginiamycin A acetyltransferase